MRVDTHATPAWHCLNFGIIFGLAMVKRGSQVIAEHIITGTVFMQTEETVGCVQQVFDNTIDC